MFQLLGNIFQSLWFVRMEHLSFYLPPSPPNSPPFDCHSPIKTPLLLSQSTSPQYSDCEVLIELVSQSFLLMIEQIFKNYFLTLSLGSVEREIVPFSSSYNFALLKLSPLFPVDCSINLAHLKICSGATAKDIVAIELVAKSFLSRFSKTIF